MREMLVRTCVHNAGLSQHSSPIYLLLPSILCRRHCSAHLITTSYLPIRRAGAGAEAESSSSTSFNMLTATSRKVKRYVGTYISRFATWPSQSDPITPILQPPKILFPFPSSLSSSQPIHLWSGSSRKLPQVPCLNAFLFDSVHVI